MPSKRRHTRKRRRHANMALRSGGKFRVNHKSKSGRTGSVFAKQVRGRQ